MGTKDIMAELTAIKSELAYIKTHMVTTDSLLTADDKKALARARAEYERGDTIPAEQLGL